MPGVPRVSGAQRCRAEISNPLRTRPRRPGGASAAEKPYPPKMARASPRKSWARFDMRDAPEHNTRPVLALVPGRASHAQYCRSSSSLASEIHSWQGTVRAKTDNMCTKLHKRTNSNSCKDTAVDIPTTRQALEEASPLFGAKMEGPHGKPPLRFQNFLPYPHCSRKHQRFTGVPRHIGQDQNFTCGGPQQSCSDFSSNRLRVPVQLEPLLMWTGSRVTELPIPECKVNHPKDFDIRWPLGSSQPGFLA